MFANKVPQRIATKCRNELLQGAATNCNKERAWQRERHEHNTKYT